MKRLPSFGLMPRVALLLTIVLHRAAGQTKSSTSGTTQKGGKTTTLLVDTDDACRLTVDDIDEGVVTPDHAKKIDVGLGDHIVKCVIEGAPDLMWRKAVEAKSSEQVVAIVALKALHIQYDQAVGQVQQQKEKATAAQEQAAAAEEKRKTQQTQFLQARDNLIGTWQWGETLTSAKCGGQIRLTLERILKVSGGIGSTPDVLTVQDTTEWHYRYFDSRTCKVTSERTRPEHARGNIKVRLDQPSVIGLRCEDCIDSEAPESIPATRPDDILASGEITPINGKKISIDWEAGGRIQGKEEYEKVE
jgi:hypothetical protein